jgi:hypothetical protein
MNAKNLLLAVAMLGSTLGCGSAPPPPVTPAGVSLPPEVEQSAEEAHAQYHPPQQ